MFAASHSYVNVGSHSPYLLFPAWPSGRVAGSAGWRTHAAIAIYSLGKA
jgi:hypothetical protein